MKKQKFNIFTLSPNCYRSENHYTLKYCLCVLESDKDNLCVSFSTVSRVNEAQIGSRSPLRKA